MSKLKVAVLVSGRGSNLQALIDYAQSAQSMADIKLVISNKKDAYALQRADQSGIITKFLDPKSYETKVEYDNAIHKILQEYDIDFICLAGYMRLLTKDFIDKWHYKIINIHPSLLPKFKGLNAQQQALESGEKVSGCTVHFVNDKMDDGLIILQESVPILKNDNVETLSARILEKEHICYVKVLDMIAKNLVSIENNQVRFNNE